MDLRLPKIRLLIRKFISWFYSPEAESEDDEGMSYWAYKFIYDKSVEEIQSILNASSGSWIWSVRDSAWYGDYLNCQPGEGVRVRIHEWEGLKYSGLLLIERGSTADRPSIDSAFRGLPNKINAREMVETEPYDLAWNNVMT